MTRFAACLAETLKWEGGWSNHPDDTGGATMKGIIQRVYDAWREQNGLARQTVRKITDDELNAIYSENYWAVVRGDELPAGLDLCVFDYGVNSGPARAVRYLQQVLGIAQDGHMGPVTIAAANAADPAETVKKLCAARRAFVRQIKSYPTFGKGWNRRIDGIEQTACTMCEAPLESAPIRPLTDPEAQAAEQGKATEEKKPVSKGTIATLAATAGAAIPTVPPVVTDNLTNASAWKSAGETFMALSAVAWTKPTLLVVVAAGMIGAVWLPKLWRSA